MARIRALFSTIALLTLLTGSANATSILEVFDDSQGTFFVTPSAGEQVWAFGVGNDAIEDTAISGISLIDGLEANDHWISSIISKEGIA